MMKKYVNTGVEKVGDKGIEKYENAVCAQMTGEWKKGKTL